MTRVGILGVGNTRFGKRDDVLIQELAFEAVKEALRDADISQREIDLSVVGSVGTRLYEGLPSAQLNEYSGFADKGPIRVEAACATGSAAIFTAYNAIASGCVETAIVIGAEKMTEVDVATSTAAGGRAGSYLWEFHMFGTSFSAYYALIARAHMSQFGTTEKDLGLVAVKNHKFAAMNPKAYFQKEISLEQALKSKTIASPLKLYDCCPITDGAAAVILASEEKIKKLGARHPIWINSIGFGSDTANLTRRESLVGLKATSEAAKMAYRKAGITPKDLDVAMVHDCFTIAEILAYEDLGFCAKGDGSRMIREGDTELTGSLPVNVDGGLKAKGHPLGATGCSMVYELTKQLRGEGGRRQVSLRNNLALAHNVGGHGFSAYVTVLRG